jgi:hypothetical protein
LTRSIVIATRISGMMPVISPAPEYALLECTFCQESRKESVLCVLDEVERNLTVHSTAHFEKQWCRRSLSHRRMVSFVNQVAALVDPAPDMCANISLSNFNSVACSIALEEHVCAVIRQEVWAASSLLL